MLSILVLVFVARPISQTLLSLFTGYVLLSELSLNWSWFTELFMAMCPNICLTCHFGVVSGRRAPINFLSVHRALSLQERSFASAGPKLFKMTLTLLRHCRSFAENIYFNCTRIAYYSVDCSCFVFLPQWFQNSIAMPLENCT